MRVPLHGTAHHGSVPRDDGELAAHNDTVGQIAATVPVRVPVTGTAPAPRLPVPVGHREIIRRSRPTQWNLRLARARIVRTV